MDHNELLLYNATSHYQLELDEEEEFLGHLCLLTAVLIMGLNEDHAWSVCQDLATLSQKTTLSCCPNPMLGLFLDRPQGISKAFV